MKKKEIEVKKVKIEVLEYSQADASKLKEYFEKWEKLTDEAINHYSRKPNIPEGVTEGIVAYLAKGGMRKIDVKSKPKGTKASYDCYSSISNNRIQVKACASEGPTSFGPETEWDKIVFVDFYNDGDIDGTFKIYDASDVDFDNLKVNKDQSLKDQKDEKRRPRISMLKIIEDNDLKEIYSGNIKDIAKMKASYSTLHI